MRMMVDRKILSKSIDLAMLASGRGAKDAALANVLFKVAPTTASLESYDTHAFSKVRFPVTSDFTGEFAVDGSKLNNLVNSADDGEVVFDVTADGVTVSFGRAQINLRTFPVDKYVRMEPNGLREISGGVRAAVLLSAIEFVRPFIGKDTQKPSLMNAELRNKRFLAGDGSRIGVVTVDQFDFGMRIPNSVISNCIRWLKETAAGCGDDEVKMVNILESQDFHFMQTEGDTAMFGWRRPEHEFLAIENHIASLMSESESRFVFRVDRESIQRMVSALAVVLESGAERLSFGLKAEDDSSFLLGKAQDSRAVESQNQVRIMVDHQNGKNEFDLRYSHLLETLKLTSSPVISCDVNMSKNILSIRETAPEMEKTALLTLMTE